MTFAGIADAILKHMIDKDADGELLRAILEIKVSRDNNVHERALAQGRVYAEMMSVKESEITNVITANLLDGSMMIASFDPRTPQKLWDDQIELLISSMSDPKKRTE